VTIFDGEMLPEVLLKSILCTGATLRVDLLDQHRPCLSALASFDMALSNATGDTVYRW